MKKLAYADPPYLGCGKLYKEFHANAMDWNDPLIHRELVKLLHDEYEGWVLHLAATPEAIALYAPLIEHTPGVRWCSWVKPFAAFKRNVPVAYAHEPVIIKAARKPVVNHRVVMRDWIAEPITLQRGLTGAKPEKVCHWAFELMGAHPDDDLHDMFPGTGAVGMAWASWQQQLCLELPIVDSAEAQTPNE